MNRYVTGPDVADRKAARRHRLLCVILSSITLGECIGAGIMGWIIGKPSLNMLVSLIAIAVVAAWVLGFASYSTLQDRRS